MQELTVARMGARGDGIAPGPVYVPLTLPGERVRATVAEERGVLDAVLDPSPDRIEPACPHFGTCGGCALQHWARAPYLSWKREVVAEALGRAGVEAPVGEVIDATAAGRRRATFHGVRAKAVGFAFGFARRASHAVFDLEACPVLTPRLQACVPLLKRLAERLLTRAGRVDVHAADTETGLDVDVRGGTARDDDPDLRVDLAGLAEEGDWARLTWRGETVAGRRAPVVRFGATPVTPPPSGFLQATAEGEAALAAIVGRVAQNAKLALDLFCGAGAFALRIAETTPVHAVDGDKPSVAALKRAAAKAHGLKPVTAIARDLARSPMVAKELARFDTVVLDPPRAGAAAQVRELCKSKIASLAYVSCNPATFARDAKSLIEAGFALETVTPVDQFLWSPHVELAGEFRR